MRRLHLTYTTTGYQLHSDTTCLTLAARNKVLGEALTTGKWRNKKRVRLPAGAVSTLAWSTLVSLLYTERVDLASVAQIDTVIPLLKKVSMPMPLSLSQPLLVNLCWSVCWTIASFSHLCLHRPLA